MWGGSVPLLTSDALWSRSSGLKNRGGWSVSPSSGSPVGWLSGEMAKDQYLSASEGQIVSLGMSNNRGFEDTGDQLHRSIPYHTLTFIISPLITHLPFSGEMLSPFSKASNQSCGGIANTDLPFSSTWKAKREKACSGLRWAAGKGRRAGISALWSEAAQTARARQNLLQSGRRASQMFSFSLSPAGQCFSGLLVFFSCLRYLSCSL